MPRECMMHHICDCLNNKLTELYDHSATLKAALAQIRDEYGQACEGYMSCTHASCRSSYSAWATAYEALLAAYTARGWLAEAEHFSFIYRGERQRQKKRRERGEYGGRGYEGKNG